MKKTAFPIIVLIVVALLVLTTVQVMASPAPDQSQAGSGAGLAVKPTQKPAGNSADAPGKSKGKPVHIKGIIASVDPASLVITTDGGGSITVVITTDTRIQVASLGKAAGIEALKPGLQVGVQATDKEGVLTARSIHVIPGKPVLGHHVGMVSDYQAGVSITITDKDGQTYTYLLSPDLKILPEDRAGLLIVGAYVTIISPRDVTTTDLVATGIVVHPAVPPGQAITPAP